MISGTIDREDPWDPVDVMAVDPSRENKETHQQKNVNISNHMTEEAPVGVEIENFHCEKCRKNNNSS